MSISIATPLLEPRASAPLGELYIAVARAWLAENQADEAATAAQRALELGQDSERWQAHYLLGEIALAAADFDRAASSFAHAVLIAPLSKFDRLIERIHEPMTHLLSPQQTSWLCGEWFEQLNERDLPVSARAQAARLAGRAALYAGQLDRAHGYFERALQALPDDPLLLEGIGEVHTLLGDEDAAIAELERALKLGAAYPERTAIVRIRLARAVLRANNPARALSELPDLSEVPEHWQTRFYLARADARLAQGSFEDALSDAQTVLRVEPANIDAHVLRARSFIALHRYEEALNAADDALREDPSSRWALIAKIQALLESGRDAAEAERLLKHLIEREGGMAVRSALDELDRPARAHDGNLQYFLARTQILCGEDYDAAAVLEQLAAAEELRIQAPEAIDAQNLNAGFYAAKAIALQKLGRNSEAADSWLAAGREKYGAARVTVEYEEARTQLQSALDLNENLVEAVWHIVDIDRVLSYNLREPKEIRELLTRASAQWLEAAARQPDAAEESWPLAVMANVQERLADVQTGADARSSMWRAVGYSERAIVTEPQSASYWATLARHLRTAAERNSLFAARRALSLDPSDAAALEEQAIATINIGRPEEALPLLAELITSAPADLRFVRWKALCHRTLRQYDDALLIVRQDNVIPDDDIWSRKLRADTLRAAGQEQLAVPDYEWLYAQLHDPLQVEPRFECGEAALRLGHYSEAEAIARELLVEYPFSTVPYYWLAEIELKNGRTDEMSAHLDAILRIARTGLDITEVDIEQLLQRADKENWPAAQQARDLVEGATGWLARARERSMQLRAVTEMEELERIIGEVDGEIGYAPRLALARLYTESLNTKRALAIYTEAAQYGLPDRVAEGGHARVREIVFAAAREQVRALQTSEAAALIAELPPNDLERATFLALRGVIAALNNEADACDLFARAASVFGDVPEGAAEALAAPVRDALASPQAFRKVDEEFGKLEQSHPELAGARAALRRWLEEYWQCAGDVETDGYYLAVTPIAVDLQTDMYEDLAAGLLPELEAVRQRVLEHIGIDIPQAQVRYSDSLSPNQYQVKIREVQAATGFVAKNARWCAIPVEQLRANGFDDANLAPAPHPVGGSPGCWISVTDPHGDAFATSYLDPVRYISAHAQAVVVQNLHEIIGLDETRAWLNSIAESSVDERLQTVARDSDPLIFAAHRLLCMLLREGVPVVTRQDILTALLESDTIDDALTRVRRSIRSLLPGNAQPDRWVRAPADAESLVRKWLNNTPSGASLVIAPEDVSTVLDELREILKQPANGTAVVVRDPLVRRALAAIIQLEWPNVSTLSVDELIGVFPEPETLVAT